MGGMTITVGGGCVEGGTARTETGGNVAGGDEVETGIRLELVEVVRSDAVSTARVSVLSSVLRNTKRTMSVMPPANIATTASIARRWRDSSGIRGMPSHLHFRRRRLLSAVLR